MCVTEKPNHVGHATDLTATQLGKNKKKKEEKVAHILLFNGMCSFSSSSKISCKA